MEKSEIIAAIEALTKLLDVMTSREEKSPEWLTSKLKELTEKL